MVFLLLRFHPDVVHVRIGWASALVIGNFREALRDSPERLAGNACYANVVAHCNAGHPKKLAQVQRFRARNRRDASQHVQRLYEFGAESLALD